LCLADLAKCSRRIGYFDGQNCDVDFWKLGLHQLAQRLGRMTGVINVPNEFDEARKMGDISHDKRMMAGSSLASHIPEDCLSENADRIST